MTKPKHVKYLEQFSERLEDMDLNPGDVVGMLGNHNSCIRLHLVADSDGGSELLSFQPYYVELVLGHGKPEYIERAFMYYGPKTLDSESKLYKINTGTDLHNYGSILEGMNLPPESVIPLTKATTLSRIVKRLERSGLGHSLNSKTLRIGH